MALQKGRVWIIVQLELKPDAAGVLIVVGEKRRVFWLGEDVRIR